MFPRRLRAWTPAVLVAVAVLAASVAHPETLAALRDVLPLPSGAGDGGGAGLPIPADKLGHLAFYAVLAAATVRGTVGTPSVRRPLLVAAAAAFLYGLGIELLQSQLPYRSMEVLDAAANGVGAAVGAGAAGLVRRAGTAERGGSE